MGCSVHISSDAHYYVSKLAQSTSLESHHCTVLYCMCAVRQYQRADHWSEQLKRFHGNSRMLYHEQHLAVCITMSTARSRSSSSWQRFPDSCCSNSGLVIILYTVPFVFQSIMWCPHLRGILWNRLSVGQTPTSPPVTWSTSTGSSSVTSSPRSSMTCSSDCLDRNPSEN